MKLLTLPISLIALLFVLSGCAKTGSLTVMPPALGDYHINISPSEPTAGETVMFEVLRPDGFVEFDSATSFRWEFGDRSFAYGSRVEHTFKTESEYFVRLSMKRLDGSERMADQFLNVQPRLPEPETQPAAPKLPEIGDCLNVKIEIILPNPSSPEPDNEWIQLRNFCDVDLDLNGWTIAASHTSFTFDATTIILYNGTRRVNGLIFNPLGSLKHLYLRNTGDMIKLINPLGEVQHECRYLDADEIEDVEFLCLT
jgi:hypothetical protein